MEVSVLDNEKLAIDNDYEHRFAEHEVHIPAPSRGLPHASGSAGASLRSTLFVLRGKAGEVRDRSRVATR